MARPVYPQNLEDPDIIWLIRNYRNQMADHQIWVYDVPGEPVFLMRFENTPRKKLALPSQNSVAIGSEHAAETQQDEAETRESE